MNTELLQPTRGRARKEFSTLDMEIGQSPRLNLDTDLDIQRNETILSVDNGVGMDQLQKLAFMEEPVTIRLEATSEKYAPRQVPVWSNGKGAEVLGPDGKWVGITYLPVGQILTTKRKYVEILVRAKPQDVQTVHEDATAERPRNEVVRTTRSANPLTVIRDENPLGYQWLTQTMAEG